MVALALALPDPVLARARRAASAAGQTVEEYLADLVGASLPDLSEPTQTEEVPLVRLTPEQLEGVRRAQAQIVAGEGIPLEEFLAARNVRRSEWASRGR